MKILIIPDVHCRKFWRKEIEEKADLVDKVIFLGDYLDPYPFEPFDTLEGRTLESHIKMLNDIISLKKNNPDKYILLTGNHTDHYIWSNCRLSSRYNRFYAKDYNNFILQNLDYFNFVWIENNVIFSHAGITKDWAERVAEKLELPEILSVMEIAVMFRDLPLKDFTNKIITLISDISPYRGGDAFSGSCEWADVREHVDYLEPDGVTIHTLGENGLYQIFGHTQLKKPLITDKWACLDCRKGFIFDTITYSIDDGSNNSL